MRAFLVTFIVIFLSTSVSANTQWQVISKGWRPDENPFVDEQPWEGFRWAEGWREAEQFYPKYFKPSGSIHLILRNVSETTGNLRLSHYDSSPLEEVIMTPLQSGQIIWNTVQPESVVPGEWVECIIRLRSIPLHPVTLTFDTGNDPFKITVDFEASPYRFESVSFSPNIDRIFLYIRDLRGNEVPAGKFFLNDKEIPEAQWAVGPKFSGVSLVEVPLESPLEYGHYQLLEVRMPDGEILAQPIRAWDNHFCIGLFGPAKPDDVKDARQHGFDTYFTWAGNETLDEFGMNYIAQNFDSGKTRTKKTSGMLMYYNIDEPDAHDWKPGKELPYMDRLGVNAEMKVIPQIKALRAARPTVPDLLLVNNTYKPLNWYVYGQIPDVYSTDPYVPFSGDQLERVPSSLTVARDACAPAPLVAVLWGTHIEGAKFSKRMASPKEERMMVFYALGCGVKGIGYFADIGAKTNEGQFHALSDNEALWEEVGAINRDVRALAPFLSRGCLLPVSSSNDRVWVRTLMCGRDRLLVIAVNKDHYIGYNTNNNFAWHNVTKNVEITLPIPERFDNCSVSELRDGVLKPFETLPQREVVTLEIDKLDTARAFILQNHN